MLNGDHEIPQEVASRQALDHASSAGVAPDSLFPGHVLAVLIREHDPEGQDADHDTLEERDHMDVPVDLAIRRQLGVLDGEDDRGDPWSDDNVDKSVAQEGDQDLMDVQRQGGQGQIVGKGLNGFAQPFLARNGEGILQRSDHDCRRKCSSREEEKKEKEGGLRV